MSLGNWFRRMFSPSAGARSAEDAAALREEYGGNEAFEQSTGGGAVAGGVSGLAGLESAEAARAEEEEFEPPPDPAP